MERTGAEEGMSALSMFGGSGPSVEAMRAQSLDQLWHEAEQLGVVTVDNGWNGGAYEAKIRFSRASGTSITAVGKSDQIAFALAKAIDEAREMGAGRQA
jgi:hypothetical protein